MTDLDRQCDEALRRLNEWINRSCGQHMRQMRRGWR